tara:strand:+ start:233 stop:460 length:228 start_codon:yes stop_codon:yes gene_type:complete
MDGNKKFWQSKKCLAYLILMTASTGIILAAIATRQATEVIREAISAYGLAVTAASAALIGGQSYVDSKIAKRPDK